MTTIQIEWNKDIEDSLDSEREIKIFRTHYKGFDITVYPLTKVLENGKGYEYELYNEERNINWDSLFETSNTIISIDSHNDHAEDAEQAKKWAIRTVDEWDD